MIQALEQVTPFLGSQAVQSIEAKGIYLLGFGFDGTCSYRGGTRKGPAAIREASTNLEDYSPYLDKDTSQIAPLYDLGNLPLHPARWDLMHKIFQQHFDHLDLPGLQSRLVTLGGEHSISLSPISLYLKHYPDLILLHLDAHADLRDGYLGAKYSHASIIRRVLDHFGPDHQLIQYGIRSGTREEFQWMRQQKTLRENLAQLCCDLQAIPDERPIYLTLDLDFFDPAFMPGTGTPEAGGENFLSFIEIIKILYQKNFVGADITELSPDIDPSGASSCFAAKVVREILLSLS